MARLFGLIGNRADLAASVLDLEREVLSVPPGLMPAGPLSWGIGFYQGGDVLIRRRPHDEHNSLDAGKLTKDLRSDLILGHVRAATVGSIRAENTHPFRYREWLFAHTGSVELFSRIRERLVESIPEFLRRNIRGDTDSELLFHVILSFLHDAGRLHDGGAEARTIAAALSSTASLVDHLVMEEGGAGGFVINAVLTNGEVMAALHRDVSTPAADAGEIPSGLRPSRMMLRVVHGREDMDALVADDALRKVRLTDPGALRFAIVASDFAPGQQARVESGSRAWTALPPRSIVTMTRDAQPHVETL